VGKSFADQSIQRKKHKSAKNHRERRKELYMYTNKLTDKQTATKNTKQANKPKCRASLVSDLGKEKRNWLIVLGWAWGGEGGIFFLSWKK